MDVIKKLRETLVPQGSLPVVHLFLNKASYFNEKDVQDCINELQTSIQLESQLSPLQRLATAVLLDSAYIDLGLDKPYTGQKLGE